MCTCFPARIFTRIIIANYYQYACFEVFSRTTHVQWSVTLNCCSIVQSIPNTSVMYPLSVQYFLLTDSMWSYHLLRQAYGDGVCTGLDIARRTFPMHSLRTSRCASTLISDGVLLFTQRLKSYFPELDGVLVLYFGIVIMPWGPHTHTHTLWGAHTHQASIWVKGEY